MNAPNNIWIGLDTPLGKQHCRLDSVMAVSDRVVYLNTGISLEIDDVADDVVATMLEALQVKPLNTSYSNPFVRFPMLMGAIWVVHTAVLQVGESELADRTRLTLVGGAQVLIMMDVQQLFAHLTEWRHTMLRRMQLARAVLDDPDL